MKATKIGLVGSGIMASQLAEFFLKNRFDVILYARSKDSIKKCVDRFKDKTLVLKLKKTNEITQLENYNFILECVKEDIKIKSYIFAKLDRICNKATILASNTSSITIKEISAICKNKDRVVGVHFSNPVYVMKAVEVVKSEDVSKKTLDYTINLLKSLGKEPVIVGDTPGFLLNRILFTMLNEAAYLLYKNISTKEDIDKIMTLGANIPMGPFKILDLIGIDVAVDILNNLYARLKEEKYKPCPLLLDMVKEKRLGRKTGTGFYSY